MKIKGLSADIWDGGEEVYARGRHCPLLQKCHICEFCHHTYFTCGSGHVTCEDCQPKSTAKKDNAPCKACKKATFKVELPKNLMERIHFSCGCGFFGTLATIKRHRAPGEYNPMCDEPRMDDDPILLDLMPEIDECLKVLRAMKLDIQTKLDRLRALSSTTGLELVDNGKLKASQRKIEDLGNRGQILVDEYRELKGLNGQVRALLDTVVSPLTLVKFPLEGVLKGRLVEKLVMTNSMAVTIRMGLNSRGTADLYIRGTFQRGVCLPKNMAGKLLVTRHHDPNGYTLKEASFTVQSDGTLGMDEPYSSNLTEKHPELPEFRKLPNFIDCSQLFGPAVLISDWIQVSVALHT